jgi:hypothetical protein
MRTIIAGSRPKYWPANFDYIAEINLAVAASKFVITEVVSGRAAGFDQWGETWAEGVGIPWKPFPADWDRFGNSAGYKRNKQMAEYAQAAVIIWDGSSRGTGHMIDLAKLHNLKLYVHLPLKRVTVNRHDTTLTFRKGTS